MDGNDGEKKLEATREKCVYGTRNHLIKKKSLVKFCKMIVEVDPMKKAYYAFELAVFLFVCLC